jgi:hypothetical protein
MRILSIIALGAALAATPALAAPASKAAGKAPSKAATAAPTTESPAEVKDAMLNLKVLISALQSDKIEQPVKGALVGCMYNNSLGKITDSMEKLIADNPGKVSRDNPNQVLSALLAVCGYRAESTAAGAPTAGPAPAPTATPAGR